MRAKFGIGVQARGAGVAVGLAALLIGLGLASQARAAAPASPGQAAEIGKEAYDYGFPMLEFMRVRREMTSVRCPDHAGDAPINSFSNARKFADASVHVVVAPNTDTLYSIAHLDLSRGPVVLSHPRMGKRYYGFELLDPYTNVIDIPGAREDGGKAGSYEIRWTGAKHNRTKAPRADRVIQSKYRRVWVIGRTLAERGRDQRRAYRKMRRYKLTLPNGHARHFAKGCKAGDPKQFPTPRTGRRFIARLNRALAQNPPPKRDAPMLAKLAPYGIGPGLSADGAGLAPGVRVALHKGIAGEAAALPTAARLEAFKGSLKTNGWYMLPPNVGAYGTDYRTRALIATAGLGANTNAEATYPVGIGDGSGALYSGANDYRLTFAKGEAPPARYFWSLTMYDADGYLVDNPDDRYTVGPTHPPLARKKDGSVVVAIQQTKPTERHVNWLPSPPGQFRLNLRLYGPRRSVLNGTWLPPGVVNLGPAG